MLLYAALCCTRLLSAALLGIDCDAPQLQSERELALCLVGQLRGVCKARQGLKHEAGTINVHLPLRTPVPLIY